MNRDMVLVRRIALSTAALAPGSLLQSLEGVEPDSFFVHAQWMQKAGLLHAFISPYIGGGGAVNIQRLTLEGRDFADSVRKDTL